MTSLKKSAFELAATLAAAVAVTAPAVVSGEPVDWCNSGRLDEEANRPWSDAGTVMPVSEAHRAQAERRLQRRGLVRVSARFAQEVTGIPATPTPGFRYALVRAGMVGSPNSTVIEHLERSGRIHIFASLSRDRRTLLVSTHEMSPPFPTRRLPVIVRVPNSVVNVASRCSASP